MKEISPRNKVSGRNPNFSSLVPIEYLISEQLHYESIMEPILRPLLIRRSCCYAVRLQGHWPKNRHIQMATVHIINKNGGAA